MKRLPTEIKRAKGTLQPCRTNENEPKPDCDSVEMPETLSDYAKTVWNKVCPQLLAVRVMTNLDVIALANYCEDMATIRQADEALAKDGMIIFTANGEPKPSPWVGIKNKAADRVFRVSGDFGMTPASRSKVSATPAPKESKLEQFKKRKAG